MAQTVDRNAHQEGTTVLCRSCGKQIEADARFCRYCGTAQAEPTSGATAAATGPTASPAATGTRPARGGGLEERLRRLFPRHHLQDEFMHLATIVAFVIAVIGFIFGMTALWAFGVTWLLFAIALLLFLMIRESTLSHVRTHPDAERSQRPRAVRPSPAPPATAGGGTVEPARPAPAGPAAPPAASGAPPKR